MTYEEYEKLQAVRWSNLKEMRRSPKHYKWRLDHPREDTDSFRLGRAVHVSVLEPDRFPLEVAVFQTGARRGKDWETFKAANAARTILKADEYEMCLGIRDSVRAHPVARRLLEKIEAEKTITWTDSRTGLVCKGRVDALGASLVDLKTDAQLHPRRFPSTCARYGYHCQLAFYLAGLRANGIEPQSVKIIVVESVPPHDVGVLDVGVNELWAGEEEANELLGRVAACTAAGEWPGMFGDEEKALELPAWSFPQDDETDPAMGMIVAAQEA